MPGRRMALDEHEIAAVLVRRRVPEMVEADVVERRRRREARDVAADVRVLVRAHHHRHRVPARVRADALLDRLVAGNAHLLARRGIVLMYAVFAENGRYAPERRALSISCSIRKCARSGPSAASTPSSASSHSRVSCGIDIGNAVHGRLRVLFVIVAVIVCGRACAAARGPRRCSTPRTPRSRSGSCRSASTAARTTAARRRRPRT